LGETGHFMLARGMRCMRIALLLILLCSCSTEQGPRGRQVEGLLLATPAADVAIFAWDEHGTPIVTIPSTDKVVRQLDALSSSKCIAVIYDATFVIAAQRLARDSAPRSKVYLANLLEIVRAEPTRRSDKDLRQILNQANISADGMCSAGKAGQLHLISDTYLTASRPTKRS